MLMDMDQDTAKRLCEEGGYFVFLDVPEGTEFGIDMKTWNTGEKFRGVKMIPPGIHFVFYSSVSTTEDIAPRSGFFHNFKRSEVLVKKWDKRTEDICTKPVSEAEIVGFKENIRALDEFLGPYPYDILDKWKNLTKHITDDILHRLTPLSGKINSALELQSCSNADRPKGLKKGENEASQPSTSREKFRRSFDNPESELLPKLKAVEGTEIRMTEFPEKSYPEGATPSEITQHSLDKTFVLDSLLSKFSRPLDILGEMEFCYICFLVGHCLEAFEQWKKIVTLFCSCDLAIKKHRMLYDELLPILETHIKEIPEEFLADIVSNNNFVYVNLRKLFRTIQESTLDGDFKSKAARFQRFLTLTYLWDFDHLDAEEDDEAPVVVET